MRCGTRPLQLALATLLLIGCGGSDPTATSPATVDQATAVTATTAPAATPTTAPASPTMTAASTVTATMVPAMPPATATMPASPAATQSPASPTSEPAATPETLSEDDVLLAALLSAEALPEGWTLESSGVAQVQETEAAICNLHEFPGRADRLREVEAEIVSAAGDQFFSQTITHYPMIIALQSMIFARDQLGACAEWVSSDGVVFNVAPDMDPLLGTNGLAYTLGIELRDGRRMEGALVILRAHTLVSTIAYLGPEGADTAPMRQAAYDAMPRLEIAYQAIEGDETFTDLPLAMRIASTLLSHVEVATLPERWLAVGVRVPDEPQRYNVCGLDLFTETFGAVEELQSEFVVDRDLGPFLWQSISGFASTSDAEDALAHVRETVSCAEFSDNTGNTWQTLDFPDVPLGDEAHAVIVGIDLGEQGSAQGEFLFVRVGDQITVVIYVVSNATLDHSRVESIARMAVEKMERYQR